MRTITEKLSSITYRAATNDDNVNGVGTTLHNKCKKFYFPKLYEYPYYDTDMLVLQILENEGIVYDECVEYDATISLRNNGVEVAFIDIEMAQLIYGVK